MKDQLIRYIDLLFAAAPEAEEIKQEILHNTLDRYDDLIAQGKSPQAAYQLAISGIGDISEILGQTTCDAAEETINEPVITQPAAKSGWRKILRAVAICLYIVSLIPLLVLESIGLEVIGLCGTLAIAAVATALILIAAGGESKKAVKEEEKPESDMTKAVNSIVWTVGLCCYFVLSFITQAWYITWVIFPLTAAVQGLIKACTDLKEAINHEN